MTLSLASISIGIGLSILDALVCFTLRMLYSTVKVGTMLTHTHPSDTTSGPSPGQRWWQGGLAGGIGTLPMTAFMLLTQRYLPKGQRYALPPEIITYEVLQKAKISHHFSKKATLAATALSHCGYGATMGLFYHLFKIGEPLPVVGRGILFGVLVWAASYLGLLPLLGFLESGHVEPPQRNWMMIVAHCIWGTTTALVADRLARA